jgi:N-acetyl-alpha-D-muramate 1-phosphate uridylyltransferase
MKAIILAAGEGRRLLPLTLDTPKPLLKVRGKYLIEHHIDRLVAAGCTDLVINLFYLGNKIERALGDGHRFGADISYSREERLLETGGGIANSMTMLGQDDFIVVNGDIYTDFDFEGLNRLDPGILGHLVMVDNPSHHLDGDFAINDEGMLARESACLTYSGIAVLSPLLFAGCDTGSFPLRDLLDPAIVSGRMSAEHFKGQWTDVGRFEDLRLLQG